MATHPDLTFFRAVTAEDIERCKEIRLEIFVTEQGYKYEEEMDEKEEGSDHFLLLHKGEPVGTIRYYPPMGKLGRLGVRKSARGLKLGKVLVEGLEESVRTRQGKAGTAHEEQSTVTIVANSQAYAEGFYSKCGYTREDPEFLEDGQPHVRMVKVVQLE